MRPLISHIELEDRLDAVVSCDVRWSLTDPTHGFRTYESGHIPGAIFMDLDRDLSSSPGANGRHPLPRPEEFAVTLGRLGIAPGDDVVVYDDVRGAIAARMWWMLRSIGHERVRLLDGGYQVWVDAGHPIETGAVTRTPVEYPPPTSFQGVVDIDSVARRPLIDARSTERYTGATEPVDPKAGHIPGAVSLPYEENLASDGTFLPPEDLARRFAEVAQNPVSSCGSGVTACHNALAMVLAGREMPDIYIGSFSEWSRRDLPVHTGNTP